jgi:hypothetical protein
MSSTKRVSRPELFFHLATQILQGFDYLWNVENSTKTLIFSALTAYAFNLHVFNGLTGSQAALLYFQ